MKSKIVDSNNHVDASMLKDTIVLVRGKRIIVDSDLAHLYGVKTKRLKEQVKRNSERFTRDFMFEMTLDEVEKVVANCDHLKQLKYSSILPLAFTEHGAVMAANVLNSRVAIEASIMVVRAFIYAREVVAEHLDLKKRLDNLEMRVARGFEDNEEELNAIRLAPQQLMMPIESDVMNPIGFGQRK